MTGQGGAMVQPGGKMPDEAQVIEQLVSDVEGLKNHLFLAEACVGRIRSGLAEDAGSVVSDNLEWLLDHLSTLTLECSGAWRDAVKASDRMVRH